MKKKNVKRENLSQDIPESVLFRYLCKDYKKEKEKNSLLRILVNNIKRELESVLAANEKLKKKVSHYKKKESQEIEKLRAEIKELKKINKQLVYILKQNKSTNDDLQDK